VLKITWQVKAIKMISRINPHPHPVQEAPRPKPKRSWSQSNNTSSINNLNKPVRQPCCLFTLISFWIIDHIYVNILAELQSEIRNNLILPEYNLNRINAISEETRGILNGFSMVPVNCF